MKKMTNIKENTKQSATSSQSLRGTKQSHDATANNQQIASAKKPRNDRNNKMTNTTKHTKPLLPKLRFKEFEGEWEKKKLGSVSEMTSSKRVYLSDYVNDGVPFYRGKEISELRLNKTPDDILYISRERYEDFKEKFGIPSIGDILITAVGTLGNVLRIRNDDEFYFKDGNLIWLKNIKVDSEFLETLIQWKNNDLIKTSIGSTQKALTMVELRKLKFAFPNLPEQQKIANFLTAVDTKLQQLTTKKEKLAQYKKGVMQQLFSQQLRFKPDVTNETVIASACCEERRKLDDAISPNETEFPDWEFPHANVLFKSVSDKKHNSDLPILAITQDQGAIPRDMINYQMIVTDKSVASYKVVQVGDFIISLRSFQGGIEYSNYHGICSPAYNILRPTSENVNSDFYRIYLKTEFYIKQLQKRLEGIRDGKMISYKYFSEIKLPFPSLKEQQKIANYLSAIDKKIEAVQTQITKTQAFKKGLLQQMFV